ncbi:Monocarboxylate transporter 9 [Nymphon striatum]|nr:Monocarboxylate transporter 9 [Nymphon striatum]
MINNPRYSLRQDGRHSHVTFIATVCLGAKELGRYGFGRVNSIMDDSNTSKASTRQGKAVDPRHELDGKYSWVVAVCCLLHYFVTFGIIKSSGVISVRLYQTFNMTRSQAVTIPIVMFGSEFTAGIICSSILKCLGFRRTIFGAITSVFIGLFSSSFVRTPGLLCLTMGVIVGLGLGTINVTMISIPSRFFKANLGKATGFAITGSGIGGFVFPPLIKYIEDIYGLSGTFLLLSGVVLHLYVFASLIIEPPDRHLAPNPGHETDNEANQEVQATFEMDENVSCKSKSENLSIISDNKLQKLDDEKCEGFLNKALEIDEVQVPRDSANNHTLSESGLPSAAISNTQENTSKVKSEDRTMWSRMKCCCAMPFHKKSLKNFFKENLSVMRNKYCIAIGFSYLPLKLSLSLSSITFPDIAVGLGFSLTQGAMLISIIASMDILSRVVNGFFLDTKLVSLGFTFGFPLLCLGICIISVGFLEKTASYVSMAGISAVFGFSYGMALLHFPMTAAHYLGMKNVPTVMSFASLLAILPTFASSPLIDYFLKHYGQYANMLYIDGVIYILASIFWIVTGVKETRLRCSQKDSNSKMDNKKLDKETILYMLNFHGVSAEKCLDLMIENEEQYLVGGTFPTDGEIAEMATPLFWVIPLFCRDWGRSSGLHDTGSITGAMPTSVASYPYWSGSGLVTAGVGACNHILHCRYARFRCSRSLNVEQRSVAGVCLQMDAAECRVEQGDLLWRPSIWEECRKLLAGTETQIAELASNQEEADDRIMFHINDGAVKHGVQSVLVDSPDTDVFVNLIFHFNKSWQLQKLYVKLGNRKTKKTVPVYLLVDQLDNGLVSCLPAIHMLSVVATVPARWVQSCLAWKTSMDLSLLEGFGVEELSPEITNNAEKFLVSGLKKTDCSTFD